MSCRPVLGLPAGTARKVREIATAFKRIDAAVEPENVERAIVLRELLKKAA